MLRRLGLEGALVTHRGIVTRDSDPLQAPRLTPLHRSAARFGYALWRAYAEPQWQPASEAGGERLRRGLTELRRRSRSQRQCASSQSSSAISTQTSSP